MGVLGRRGPALSSSELDRSASARASVTKQGRRQGVVLGLADQVVASGPGLADRSARMAIFGTGGLGRVDGRAALEEPLRRGRPSVDVARSVTMSPARSGSRPALRRRRNRDGPGRADRVDLVQASSAQAARSSGAGAAPNSFCGGAEATGDRADRDGGRDHVIATETELTAGRRASQGRNGPTGYNRSGTRRRARPAWQSRASGRCAPCARAEIDSSERARTCARSKLGQRVSHASRATRPMEPHAVESAPRTRSARLAALKHVLANRPHRLDAVSTKFGPRQPGCAGRSTPVRSHPHQQNRQYE